jgi:hypothetical protein
MCRGGPQFRPQLSQCPLSPPPPWCQNRPLYFVFWVVQAIILVTASFEALGSLKDGIVPSGNPPTQDLSWPRIGSLVKKTPRFAFLYSCKTSCPCQTVLRNDNVFPGQAVALDETGQSQGQGGLLLHWTPSSKESWIPLCCHSVLQIDVTFERTPMTKLGSERPRTAKRGLH